MLHSRPTVDEEMNTRCAFIPTAIVKIRDLDGSADRIHEVVVMVRMNCLDVGFGSIGILNLRHIGFVATTFSPPAELRRASSGICSFTT